MSGIFSGIQALIDSIFGPIKFLLSIIQWTNKLLSILVGVITNVITLIATLPDWLVAYASLGIAVMVIYLLLGRSTGK